jgi:hypothetical protein
MTIFSICCSQKYPATQETPHASSVGLTSILLICFASCLLVTQAAAQGAEAPAAYFVTNTMFQPGIQYNKSSADGTFQISTQDHSTSLIFEPSRLQIASAVSQAVPPYFPTAVGNEVTIYVRGAPGTPYKLTITMSATGSVGITSPGVCGQGPLLQNDILADFTSDFDNGALILVDASSQAPQASLTATKTKTFEGTTLGFTTIFQGVEYSLATLDSQSVLTSFSLILPTTNFPSCLFTGTGEVTANVTIEVSTNSCQVKVPRFGQCDGKPNHWGGEIYAYHTDGETICGRGCALTALSMALQSNNVSKVPTFLQGLQVPFSSVRQDPGTLNDLMTREPPTLLGDYTRQNDVNFKPTVKDINAILQLQGKLKFDDSFYGQTSQDSLENAVCHGGQPGTPKDTPTAVLIQVRSQCSGDPLGHYVLVTGVSLDPPSGKRVFTIADPANTGTCLNGKLITTCTTLDPTTCPQYSDGNGNPEFRIRGWVTDPPADQSELQFSLADADLLITDPLGRRAGLDPTTRVDVRDIPDASHTEDRIDDDETGEIGPTTRAINVSQPLSGVYNAQISAVRLGIVNLTLTLFAQDNSLQPLVTIPAIAAPGRTPSFTIQIDPSPGTAPSIVRIANSQSTLDDIANGFKLGLITEDESRQLSSIIQKARAESLEGDAKESQEKLQEFKDRLLRGSPDKLKQLESQILLEDVNSLLGVTQRTIRVPQDFANIQAAIDGAKPGDTILVSSGRWCGAIITKPVNLLGDHDTAITSCPSNFGPANQKRGFLVRTAATGTTIRNFTFDGQGFSDANRTPLALGIGSNLAANNVIVENNRFVGGLFGVNVNGRGWSVNDNVFEGFTLLSPPNCTGGAAIMSENAGPLRFTNTFKGNRITSSVPDGSFASCSWINELDIAIAGIVISGQDGTVISDNVVSVASNLTNDAGAGIIASDVNASNTFLTSINLVITGNDADKSKYGVIVTHGNTQGAVIHNNEGVNLVDGMTAARAKHEMPECDDNSVCR